MQKIIVYTESLPPGVIADAVTGQELKMVSSKRDLVSSLVGEKGLYAALIQRDKLDRQYRLFLRSLRENFPLLHIGVIAPADRADHLLGFHHLDSSRGEDSLKEEIRKFINSSMTTNRRERHRFDWPLKGSLSFDKENWQDFRLRSISSGGAFLECSSSFPAPGTRGFLKIVFGNFSLLTQCEVLDVRHASSNLPLGFGVLFLNLQQNAVEKIDHIIGDALIHILLEPDIEPQIPSLAEDEVMTGGFDLL